jgi:type IV secretory pathway VirB3-like protein
VQPLRCALLTEEAQDNTERSAALPRHEETPAPMTVSVAMPRYFGVTPPTLLFGVATAVLAVAIALAILGHWIAALLLALVGIGLLLLFVGAAKQKPDTALARASARRLERARDRAGWLVESFAVRSDADRRTRGLRHELLLIEEERGRKVRELGDAVYRDDKKATASLKDELRRLDESARAKEAEVTEIATAAQKRLEAARLSSQATMISSVPEPSPPPDEGTPPGPVPIPEPGPPPDEGTPPQPDPVPDPAQPPQT